MALKKWWGVMMQASLKWTVLVPALALLAACGPEKQEPKCATGQTECGGLCTDTQIDGANCGACGTVCGTGTACVAGACTANCGDGVKADVEACDDGNSDTGDGCDASCAIENGWSCQGSPSTCTTGCGDGVIAGMEICDDGNEANSDGCSASCTVEEGFACDGEPSACHSTCGDSIVAADETCDDGNTDAADGCSDVCATEDGYICSGAPSTCTTTCGDGVIAGAEVCDDGNLDAGDGCNDLCQPENGFACTGAPSVCTSTCGDGIPVGTEACDDGNTNPADGCSDVCAVETGYACNGTPSSCATVCGDSLIAGAEVCDDGNVAVGDGCGLTCETENGFTCTGEPSSCVTTCGDGILAGIEACDDGNADPADGCSDTCAIESGYTCFGVPSTCAPVCGDGITTGAETCDDGNSNPGDGCDATCAEETGFACTGAPSVCATDCGDGLILGAEVCDDGNSTAGDGCDATCAIETGFNCTGTPSACAAICGDGMIVGNETCDDQGTTGADGCSASCAIEFGYSCTGEPSACAPMLACPTGSSYMAFEATDTPLSFTTSTAADSIITVNTTGVVTLAAVGVNIDHNWAEDVDLSLVSSSGASIDLTSDNGGSSDDFIDTWFLDSATTSIVDGAAPFTGDFQPEQPLSTLFGTFAAGNWTLHAVDDEAGIDGSIEHFGLLMCVCTNCEIGEACGDTVDNDGDSQIDCSDSDCAATQACAVCGNGILTGAESCDDGNTVNGDGCDSTCAAESGFSCTGEPSTCVEICGDGQIVGTEACDDGNLDNDDGCSDVCAVEAGYACSSEPSDCAGICGDSIVVGGEGCDDGNTNAGDGCSAACAVEFAYSCAGLPSVCSVRSMMCPAGSTLQTYFASDLPQNVGASSASSVITVSSTDLVAAASVGVNMTHTWDEDVTLSLLAPGGTVDLSVERGGDGDDFADTWFEDTAGVSIAGGAAPFTGTFRPETPLAALNGSTANGSWTLSVTDAFADSDDGVLTDYALMLCTCTNCEVGLLCEDTLDNDSDGQTDCADSDCAGVAACAACGDGVVATGELCDDGNTTAGDGCDGSCQPEFGYTCSGSPSVCAGQLACPAGSTFHAFQAAGLPLPFDEVTPATSTIQVSASGVVALAAVAVDITHTWVPDVELTLTSPAATALDLSSGNGDFADEDYTQTLFVDSASTSIVDGAAPFSGPFRPEDPLSTVNGEPAAGNWVLEAADVAASDDGILNEYGLLLCIAP